MAVAVVLVGVGVVVVVVVVVVLVVLVVVVVVLVLLQAAVDTTYGIHLGDITTAPTVPGTRIDVTLPRKMPENY